MGRPERAIDPTAGPLQAFAVELRQLREIAGRPSYRELSRRSHYSVTVLSEAAGGDALPTLAVTLAYVRACGGDDSVWAERWRALDAQLGAKDSPEQTDRVDTAPYLGLATFQSADAERFFGRGKLIDELCKRLTESPFLAVFGPSGIGKSSLLRAGLIPALQNDKSGEGREWLPVVITPGEYPAAELFAKLTEVHGAPVAGSRIRDVLEGKSAQTGLLIIVDQFEEVFTLCRDRRERDEFITDLLDSIDNIDGRIRVVLGVRADFYAHCAEHPPLVAALRDRQLLVGPMDEEDLRSVILEPASIAGLKVEQALVEAVLADAADQPGALPLVSHALRETWTRRRGRILSVAAYRDTGGVQGALARTADRAFGSLDATGQKFAKELLLRLTSLTDGADYTRRRARHGELLDNPNGVAVSRVLEQLAQARLISIDEDNVTIAHEALIRNWPLLRSWLAEDRELLRQHRKLTEAAAEWDKHGREDGFLYRGTRLASYHDFPADRLNDLELAFLTEGRATVNRERAARRRRLRITGITCGAAATVVIMLATLAGMAFMRADRATAGKDSAYSRQLAAAARVQLQIDPELGLLLAKKAVDAAPTEEAATALRQAIVDTKVRAVLPTGHGPTYGIAYSPDGRLEATSGEDGTVRLWERTGHSMPGSTPRLLAGHNGPLRTPVFSPDSRSVAAAANDGAILIWDVTSDVEPRVLRGPSGTTWAVQFSPDGKRLASAHNDGTVRLWNLATGGEARVLRGHTRALAVAFSPDGTALATAGSDAMVRIWDPDAEAEPVILRGHGNTVGAVAFSRDGKQIASGSTDGTVRLWQNPGKDPVVLRGNNGTVDAVAFSPDGQRVASAGSDGSVRIWDTTASTDPLVLPGHKGSVPGIAFSPDGQELASASTDGTVRISDPTGLGAPQVLQGHEGAVWSVAVSPDGKRIVSGGDDTIVRVWPSDGRDPLNLKGHTKAVLATAFSPDGKLVASAGEDGTLRIWNLDKPDSPVVRTADDRGLVWSVAFSPDGNWVASGGNDGILRVWSTDGSGTPLLLRGHDGGIRSVAISPDSKRVASAGYDGTVRIWNVDGSAAPVVLRGHERGMVWSVAFSPDGKWLASGGNDGTVRIWRADGSGVPLVLRGHQGGPVWSVAFSADENWLASTGDDGTIRIWGDEGNHSSFAARGFGAPVNLVAFAPDSRQLVTANGDGTIRVWHCEACDSLDLVRSLADARTTRELTPAERQLFLGDPTG
ncbi:hypothetical protein [Amycolatopsis sp. NPDC059657]|uniref:nSTAND1 domain-containing NTPase n=1 Tax=Amycolatopsis sp. NPDC059657 TaxID=3346899 RepID=UPI00366BBE51